MNINDSSHFLTTLWTMKTFKVFAVSAVFLIQAVLSQPEWYTATDGTEFLVDAECEYNWYQAWHECARQDAQLVVIDTNEKNLVIMQLLANKFPIKHNLWIGGNDAYGDRQDKLRPFYWSATGEEFSFTHWALEQPDNIRHKEHCVHILHESYPAFGWNDNSCHNAEMGYICERKSLRKVLNQGNEDPVYKVAVHSVEKTKQQGNEDDIENKSDERLNHDELIKELKDMKDQLEERINPKLLAGQTKPIEDIPAMEDTGLAVNTISITNRKWKDIIKNSLRKTELDIVESLFSLAKDVDNITELDK